ncbi:MULTISPECIES: hypothetical protein [unclassified Curtobacterium]|uniref:hypothetical protein n=1 Tax=unclassified Curtobacterium TaxID=257496 RepID=UPI0011B5627B|nr:MULTISPECIES: hypothetical protein [unclassified Curtobacterium]
MRSIDFADLEPQDADEWLRFTIASHEARLTELADWMSQDFGPVARADASWSSLQTVWSWAVDFTERLGSAQYDDQIRPPSRATAFGLPLPARPIAAVAEDLVHYVFEVLRREDGSTRWALYPSSPGGRVVDVHHQETGIQIGDHWIPLEGNLPGMLRQALEGRATASAPTGLQHLLTSLLPDLATRQWSAGSESVLQPRVGRTRIEPVVPNLEDREAPRRPELERDNDFTLLAPGASDFDLMAGPGLPAQDVLTLLQPYGLEIGIDLTEMDGHFQGGSLGWLFSRGLALEAWARNGRIHALRNLPLQVTRAEIREYRRAVDAFATVHGGSTIDD